MNSEAIKPLYDTLHRYAGWLDRDRTSATVRADVAALGIAFNTNGDPLPHLTALDTSIMRLPGGALRTMLRQTSGQIRRAVEARPDAPVAVKTPFES
jgi:hypothetical protein